MALKKPTKKEWIYIGVAAAALLLWWLFSRKSTSRGIVNGAGQTPDTSYLNFNIPPVNGNGGQPNFGGINVPPVFLGKGGCNECYAPKYYGSNQDLANALGQTGADAVTEALQNMPNYMTLNVGQQYNSGTIDGVNYSVMSHLPVLALPGGTTSTVMDQPAQTSNYAPLAIKAL